MNFFRLMLGGVIFAMATLTLSACVTPNQGNDLQTQTDAKRPAPKAVSSAPAFREEAPITGDLQPSVQSVLESAKSILSNQTLTTAPAPAFQTTKYTLYGDEFSSEVVHRSGNLSVVRQSGKFGNYYVVMVGAIPLNSVAPNGVPKYAPRRFGYRKLIRKVFDIERPTTFSNRKVDGVSPSDLAIRFKAVVDLDGKETIHQYSVEPKRVRKQHVSINGQKFHLNVIELMIRDREYESRLEEWALVEYVPIIGAPVAGNFLWYTWDESRAIGTWHAWDINVSPEVLERIVSSARTATS